MSATRKRSRPRAVPLVNEVRFYNNAVAEFREDASTGLVTITGTPIVYNTPYTVTDMLGTFTERMNESVGVDAMSRQFDVRLLENHKGLPYARTKPAQGKPPTLFLQHVPGVGVRMRAVVDGNAPRVQDLLSAVERGDAGEMSVGFIVGDDQWSDDWTDREIFRFSEWLDVSVVTFAASPTTTAEIGQRMALAMPEESRARVRQVLVRAGKVLSDANQGHIASAVKSLHTVLLSNDFDPTQLLDTDEPDDTENEDGSEAGETGSGNGAGQDLVNTDGSGFRVVDLEHELAVRTQRRMEAA